MFKNKLRNLKKVNLKSFVSFWWVFGTILLIHQNAISQTIVGQWIPLNPEGVRPRERVGWQKLVYDEKHDVIWLFAAAGGERYQAYANDVWLYDVKQNFWRQIQKISTERNPSDRPSWRHAEQGRTYDASKGLIVLFGQQSDAEGKNDTWTFDVGTLTWEEIKPSGDIPPLPHFEYALEYDRNSDVSVLWGGSRAFTYPYPSDVWELNLTKREWKKYPFSPPNAPEGRRAHSLAYCDSLGGVVMFGGTNEFEANIPSYYNDIWLYQAKNHTWRKLRNQNPPPGRMQFSFDYDPINNFCMVFSGTRVSGELFSDTWIYDVSSGNWYEVETDTSPPPYGGGDMLVYARSINKFLFMSKDGNIWEFTVSTSPLGIMKDSNFDYKLVKVSNYPNPFNLSTAIYIDLSEKIFQSALRVEIVNLMGRKIRSFSLSEISRNNRIKIVWDGKDLKGRKVPPGIYFYKVYLNKPNYFSSGKMLLIQ